MNWNDCFTIKCQNISENQLKFLALEMAYIMFLMFLLFLSITLYEFFFGKQIIEIIYGPVVTLLCVWCLYIPPVSAWGFGSEVWVYSLFQQTHVMLFKRVE